MEFGEKDIKRFSIILILAVVLILSFILVKPIIYSIIGGLILAYVVFPVFERTNRFVKNRTLSGLILLFFVIVILIIPIWFISPILVQQVFELYQASQTLDLQSFIYAVFPTANEQFVTQLSVSLGGIIGKASTTIIGYLVNLFLELPKILVNMFVFGFVFFFALRDSDKLIRFVSGLSPLNREKERIIINQFKGITDSIVYGLFVVGLIQGILLGLGLLIFGIENALVLTILAIFLSVLPVLGPYLIWIPITVYLFSTGQIWIAVLYFLYNLIVVSTLDNVLRSYIVARKTDISSGIILLGIVGGVLVFGMMGILLGPLILGYLVTLLRSYRDKNLYSLFSEEGIKSEKH